MDWAFVFVFVKEGLKRDARDAAHCFCVHIFWEGNYAESLLFYIF